MQTHIASTGAARYKLLVAATAIALSLGAHAQNLVTNGDFETGDFTGWQTTAASAGPLLVVSLFGVDASGPHNGAVSAYFGATVPYDTISQSLATTAGQLYAVSFYLDSLGTNGSDAGFVGTFGGTTFVSLSGASADQAFSPVTRFVTATSGSTTLSFGAYDTGSFYTLDSVSVTAVPEPSTVALFSLGLMSIVVGSRSRRTR